MVDVPSFDLAKKVWISNCDSSNRGVLTLAALRRVLR